MFKVQHYSISKKLTLMNMLVSGVALLLACVGFCAYDLYSFRLALVRSVSIQAQIVGDNTVSALLFNDPHSAEKTLSALNANQHLLYAQIYTKDGQPFAEVTRRVVAKIRDLATGCDHVEARMSADRAGAFVELAVTPLQPHHHRVVAVGVDAEQLAPALRQRRGRLDRGRAGPDGHHYPQHRESC